MKRSESNKQLAEALAKAAAAFQPIERNCTAKVVTKSGGSYSYDYADLDAVLSAVRRPLADNGLTLSHDCTVERNPETGVLIGVNTVCTILHASDEWRESSPLFLPAEQDSRTPPAQQIGGLCTYGKRYTTQDLLGLSTEADDDANAASGNNADAGRKQKPVCPQCNKADFVYEDKKLPGSFYCWKKPENGKHGCGNKWSPAAPVDVKVRAEVKAIMERAAMEGEAAFKEAWAKLSQPERESMTADLEALKAKVVADPGLAQAVKAWSIRIKHEDTNLKRLNELLTELAAVKDKTIRMAVFPVMDAFAIGNNCHYNVDSKIFEENVA